MAAALPVMSFASGATNSMRGAAFLSGLTDAMVIDVGGTTTDIGQLRRGFPREANSVVEVGGVRTLFRMPDLLSIGLGGGSLVSADPLSVGPKSVGYRLIEEGLVFGGNTMTATDVAVAAGLVQIGDDRAVADLPRSLVQRALDLARAKIEDSVDRMKTDAQRIAADRGRRRRVLGARPPRWHLASDPCTAWRLRQCRRRRDRPGERRNRPGLSRPQPRSSDCSRPKRRPKSARSSPAPSPGRCKRSMSKTSRSLICRAMPSGSGCASPVKWLHRQIRTDWCLNKDSRASVRAGIWADGPGRRGRRPDSRCGPLTCRRSARTL